MATKAAPKNLSRSDLIKQRDQLDTVIKERYQAELKILVDAFKAHLATGEFKLADALALLKVGKKTYAKRGTAKAKAVGDKPVAGVTYKNPATSEEWTAPANLRRTKKWLDDLVKSGGKKYADFATKK